MNKKEWIKTLLWLVLPVCFWGIIGFGVHSYAAVMGGLFLYFLSGLLIPMAFVWKQKEGIGFHFGKKRAVIHAVLWISIFAVYASGWLNSMFSMERVWAENKFALLGGMFLFQLSMYIVTLALDLLFAKIHEALKNKGKFLSTWAASLFLGSFIPTSFLIAIWTTGMMNGLGLDPFTLMMILGSGVILSMWVKVFLAMLTFGTYLYFSLEGNKKERAVQASFTGILWLLAYFAPNVAAAYMTGNSSTLVAAFSSFPFLSDMWLMAFSLFAGMKITKWIFQAE